MWSFGWGDRERFFSGRGLGLSGKKRYEGVEMDCGWRIDRSYKQQAGRCFDGMKKRDTPCFGLSGLEGVGIVVRMPI